VGVSSGLRSGWPQFRSADRRSPAAYPRDLRQRVLIGLVVTVGIAFLLGFVASRGVFGSHGWTVALIVGAAICAAVAVALAPLNRRRAHAHRLHLLRR
jgi:hypothetical protein